MVRGIKILACFSFRTKIFERRNHFPFVYLEESMVLHFSKCCKETVHSVSLQIFCPESQYLTLFVGERVEEKE